MSVYDLPTSVEVGGKQYEIESDFRAILDICIALNDVELDDADKATVAIMIFYKDYEEIPEENYEEALKRCMEFINCGKNFDEKGSKGPKLVDWEQDFQVMIGPINSVAGREIRLVDYLHWWTFVSYYNEINGESFFAQVVQIRDKLARGKKLDKFEKDFYSRNREAVDLKRKYSERDEAIINEWI